MVADSAGVYTDGVNSPGGDTRPDRRWHAPAPVPMR